MRGLTDRKRKDGKLLPCTQANMITFTCSGGIVTTATVSR